MRFARGDMRDHIVSHKNDHGASYWRYGILRWRSWLKINICEIFGVVRFSTFATISAKSGSRTSFDHFVGQRQHVWRNGDPELLCRLEVHHQPELAGLLDWQVAGLCALGQFWLHRRPHAQRIGRTAGHAGRIGTKPRRTHPAFCGCAVWNIQRSDRLCLPMSAQRNLSHDMETYSSGTRVRGYACEHTRICAAPQTRPLLLPRWVSLLFESVRAGRWHAHPLGSMEPLM